MGKIRAVNTKYDTDHRLIKGRMYSDKKSKSVYKKYLQKWNRLKVDIYGEEEEEQADIDKLMKSLHDALGKDGPRKEKD